MARNGGRTNKKARGTFSLGPLLSTLPSIGSFSLSVGERVWVTAICSLQDHVAVSPFSLPLFQEVFTLLADEV